MTTETTGCRCDTLAAELQALTARLDALQASQPPEPLYSLPQTALLLYCSPRYVTLLLQTYRAQLSPARYRWDMRHRSHRMLPASDLAFLRAKLLRPSMKRMTMAQREALASAA